MNSLYICRNVGFKYPDGTTAVKDVSIEIEEGVATAVVGVTGSGKSTLLMLLGGLLQPSYGEIYYRGVLLNRYEGFRGEVGILLQNPSNQFLNNTIYDEIAYIPRQLGWSRDRVEETVSILAEKLDLLPLLDKSPFKISGGEMRRVGIAMTIVHSPETILLDEPFTDLSENHISRVRDLLIGLLREGKTIVYTSNSLDHVVGFADKILVIDGGEIIWSGSLDDVIRDMEFFTKLGVGYPSYLKIYYALGLNRHYPIPESPEELINFLRNLIQR